MDNEFQTILVTGGAGFIGSNFITFFLKKYGNYNIINFDNLTYAANLSNLKEIQSHDRYEFVKGDIGNRELVEYIFNKYDVKFVINFAAESHVDNSIKNPDIFIKTNVLGTFTLLDAAKNKWMEGPFCYKKGYESTRFIHVSTDEVYGSLGSSGYFSENSPYAPNSPYSASKASSDMIVRSYFHTYGLNCITTNCSNNYGPNQHDEKLIPTIIRNALNLNRIPIYGDGKNIRDWLYVLDHCKAINQVLHYGKCGESYNIGGNNEQENINIAIKICEILDDLVPLTNNKLKSYKELISFVNDRPGHDRRYAIDNTKIKNELGWVEQEDFLSGLLKTVNWYLAKGGYLNAK